VFSGGDMNKDEKHEKVCKDFARLSEEQQDYILGIMQALVFANATESKTSESSPVLKDK
jgi:hypothetical protein